MKTIDRAIRTLRHWTRDAGKTQLVSSLSTSPAKARGGKVMMAQVLTTKKILLSGKLTSYRLAIR